MSFLKNLCGVCCDFLPTCDFTRHPLTIGNKVILNNLLFSPFPFAKI